MEPDWVSECGTVKLWNRDCREVLASLGPYPIHCVVTDPPYNLGFDYEYGFDDKKPPAEYAAWMLERIAAMQSAMADGATLYMHQSIQNLAAIMPMLPGARMLAWCKNFSQIWPSPWNWGSWEPVIYWVKGKPRVVNKTNQAEFDRDWYVTRGALGLIRGVPQKSEHPCPKPIEAELPLIQRSSNEGDVVFDGFAGSGTTGAAAVRLRRRFFGCETNPRFFRLCVDRIQAELDSTPLLNSIEPSPQQEKLFGA